MQYIKYCAVYTVYSSTRYILWLIKLNIVVYTVLITGQYILYYIECTLYSSMYSVLYIQYSILILYSIYYLHYIPWHIYCILYTMQYTGAGHIIRISSKSWFISLIPFKMWNLYNVYIHSTQTDIFQVFISFNFDDYNWQLMKTPNSVSQKIRILLKTNTKKGFLEILANWKVWTWKVWACTALNT